MESLKNNNCQQRINQNIQIDYCRWKVSQQHNKRHDVLKNTSVESK